MALNLEEGFRTLDWKSVESVIGLSRAEIESRDFIREVRRREDEIRLDLARELNDETVADKEYLSERLRASRAARLPLSSWLLAIAGIIFVVFTGIEAATWLWNLNVVRAINTAILSPSLSRWWLLLILFILFALSVGPGVYSCYWMLFARRHRRAAVLQSPPFEAARDRAEVAQEALKQHTRMVIERYFAEIANSLTSPSFEDRLFVLAEPKTEPEIRRQTVALGLSEAGADGNDVPTEVRKTLLDRLTMLPGGSIGISGPRGVGKSTLLASLCKTNPPIRGKPALSVLTAAPVEYQGRDFLLHLFAAVCRRVQDTEGVTREQLDAAEVQAMRRWQQASLNNMIRPLARVLLLIAVMIGTIGISIVALNQEVAMSRWVAERDQALIAAGANRQAGSKKQAGIRTARQPAPPSPSLTLSPAPVFDLDLKPGLLLAMAFTAAVVASALLIATSRPFGRYFRVWQRVSELSDPPPSPALPLLDRSAAELQNIRFQRNYTSGWSGTLKVPSGLEMGSSSQMSLVGQAESLPEIVHRFREYLRAVAAHYGRVVIGIDELDKLKTAQQAEAFLNGIKSIFGVEHCFFLISVSEDALAAFDRRGIGLRDAFDSALDDVMPIDYLTLESARTLLSRRILRFHDPFLRLSHMLSGGLPRDLIRVARSTIEAARSCGQAGLTLDDATKTLIRSEIMAKVRATSIEIRAAGQTETVLSTLVAAFPSDGPVADLTAAIGNLVLQIDRSATGVPSRTISVCRELAVYCEFLVEVRNIVDSMQIPGGWDEVQRLALAERAAEVRQAFEISLPMASSRIADLRLAIAKIGATP